jgi:glycosyltransferase involved in cell wall biosynthesis
MKVLVINPWAVNNDQLYASGFIEGMNRHIMVDFATNYYYKGVIPNNKLYRLYFRLSEKMAPGVFRTVTRGIEYICNWLRVLKIIRRTNYDVVHFHWLLRYKIDVKFLKIARKKSPKMVLTAHNVLPHKNSEEYVEIHRKIYEIFDRIIVMATK